LIPETAALTEFIRAEICRLGSVSFAQFMEHALYHPEYGYYSSDRAALGRQGDYFTNVSVGAVFGRLLASQFLEIREELDRPGDFTIVEQGAHHGQFALDVMRTMRDLHPDGFHNFRYGIVEPFPRLRRRQEEALSEFRDLVQWHDSIEALEPFTGVHFSNELFDALPVYLVTTVNGSWMERRVALKHDAFVFEHATITDAALLASVKKLPKRAEGYVTEINTAASSLVASLSSKLKRGYLVAVDYGFSRSQFYDEERVGGTLQSRAQHRLLDSPFAAIGESDISVHVEWTSLVEAAEAVGFTLVGFTDQHHFLTGILAGAQFNFTNAKARRALQTLLHPEMLGRSFQVLALTKGIPHPPSVLGGFKFARDARLALDL
jgi:SAM-dependent MidA family methyltransferase